MSTKALPSPGYPMPPTKVVPSPGHPTAPPPAPPAVPEIPRVRNKSQPGTMTPSQARAFIAAKQATPGGMRASLQDEVDEQNRKRDESETARKEKEQGFADDLHNETKPAQSTNPFNDFLKKTLDHAAEERAKGVADREQHEQEKNDAPRFTNPFTQETEK